MPKLSGYIAVRYSTKINYKLTNCYLCGKRLDAESTPDHIIPDHLFSKSDPHRPTLLVHLKCNNRKSKDDQWFVKQIELRSYLDSRAKKGFDKMMDKAIKEKDMAYLVGEKIPSYKLAKGIFDKSSWGLEIVGSGRNLIQLEVSQPNALRFQRYVETMCQGLFIRNVPFSKPSKPSLIMKQYSNLDLRGKLGDFMNAITKIVDEAKGSKFGQRWEDRISYIGSRVVETPNKGFLFVQFYNEFGILATFK